MSGYCIFYFFCCNLLCDPSYISKTLGQVACGLRDFDKKLCNEHWEMLHSLEDKPLTTVVINSNKA